MTIREQVIVFGGTERMVGNVRGERVQNCRDPFQGRVVTSMGLTPRHPDGSGGQVVKNVRTGPKPLATFAAPTPYFRLSAEKRTEYEAQVAGLEAQIATPGLDPVIKTRLQQDLAKVQHLLGMDKSPTPDGRTFQELRARAG